MSRRPTVGDKVRVLPGGMSHGYNVGYVGVITKDTHDGQPYILDHRECAPRLQESQVERIEEEEPKMTELEPGQVWTRGAENYLVVPARNFAISECSTTSTHLKHKDP